MDIFITGLALGASLLLAIGPQNILVIKQGVRREGVGAVIVVCLLSDLVLFTAGTLGVGLISGTAPIIMDILRWCGIAYLLWFAALAARDTARTPRVRVVDEGEPQRIDAPTAPGGVATLTRRRATWITPMLMAIALTWLNPNAYLDAFVFIGGVGAQYGDSGRWIFAAGAFTASLIWFPAVGFGAAALSGPLSRPDVWRVINLGVALVMSALAVKLMLMG
ncbi:L-lysine exporter [Corynebacterium pacaense]|uniref:L-lysine exporter n=1 Tax=Corynebacterium pacaense TaxID=1816684 RepID=UPI001177CDE4